MTAVLEREALRTEVEVATDVVVLLMAESVIPRRPEVMLTIARVLGFSVQDLRDADTRHQRGYARPPESRSCLPPVDPPSKPKRPDLIMRTRPEGHEHKAPASPLPTTPHRTVTVVPPAPVVTPAPPAPVETVEKALCTACARPRVVTEFRSGSKVCKLCVWRKARRTRFLASWGAHSLAEHDELIGAPCAACGEAFRPGQRIFAAEVVVAHERCPKGGV